MTIDDNCDNCDDLDLPPVSTSPLIRIGLGFSAVHGSMPVRAGDEYCTRGGRFVPVEDWQVGQPVAAGTVARRALQAA